MRRADGLLKKNDLDGAASLFRRVIDKFPNNWLGHNGLGVALAQRGKTDEAASLYEIAISLAPDHAGPWNNLGYARVGQGKIDEGIADYHKALALRPDYANAHNNLGNAYLEKLALDDAMQSYETALFIEPDHADAHWNRALLHLLKGDFARGWLEYEWRWPKFPQFKRHFRQPKWDGFDIAGKTILIHAEQGFGDTIQFARLAPLVSQRACNRQPGMPAQAFRADAAYPRRC